MAPRSRRDEVLELAGDLFARNGYATTTVRDIATAAGILSGSLYHHFPSKEAIVDALLAPFLDELLGRYDEILAAELAPVTAFEALATASLDALDEHGTAIAIYEDDGRRLEAQPHFSYLRDGSERLRAAWIGTIEQGIAAGAFRSDLDPRLTYAFVRATLWDCARRTAAGDDGRGTAAVADRQLELLLRGIAAAPAAEAAPEAAEPAPASAEPTADRPKKKNKKGKKKKG